MVNTCDCSKGSKTPCKDPCENCICAEKQEKSINDSIEASMGILKDSNHCRDHIGDMVTDAYKSKKWLMDKYLGGNTSIKVADLEDIKLDDNSFNQTTEFVDMWLRGYFKFKYGSMYKSCGIDVRGNSCTVQYYKYVPYLKTTTSVKVKQKITKVWATLECQKFLNYMNDTSWDYERDPSIKVQQEFKNYAEYYTIDCGSRCESAEPILVRWEFKNVQQDFPESTVTMANCLTLFYQKIKTKGELILTVAPEEIFGVNSNANYSSCLDTEGCYFATTTAYIKDPFTMLAIIKINDNHT